MHWKTMSICCSLQTAKEIQNVTRQELTSISQGNISWGIRGISSWLDFCTKVDVKCTMT